MMQATSLLSLHNAILAALRSGRRTQGELRDLLDVPYSTLTPILESLVHRKQIESFFEYHGAIPHLAYRLPCQSRTSLLDSIRSFWRRH